MSDEAPASTRRPRVEGDREGAILDATLTVLAEVGYDRLTMDQVAATARASKATLYRRWEGKADLVVDALGRSKHLPTEEPDTGSLREDLLASMCGSADDTGWNDQMPTSVVAGLVTALNTDATLARAFRERFLVERVAVMSAMFERARARGEVGDVDVDLLMTVVPALSWHRSLILGLPADRAFVTAVVDRVLLPAAAAHVDRPH